MLDWLSIWGTYKVQERNNNVGAGKYVLGLMAIVVIGYLIIRGVVAATGFENLYGIVGNLLVDGLKITTALFVFAVSLVVGLAILRGLFKILITIDDSIRGSNKKDKNYLKNNF